jgi:tRNA(Ile)-lysidine synthase
MVNCQRSIRQGAILRPARSRDFGESCYNSRVDTLRAVRQSIRRYQLLSPGNTVVVGVSGGPDSLCLLHMLRALAPEFDARLHVAHLHHGLRGSEADADAAFVQKIAAAWGLPSTIDRADVSTLAAQASASLEEAAREARYVFLGRLATQLGAPVVAVGHNADDQAETVLMHFLRGSGLAGLRGMRPQSSLPPPRVSGVRYQVSGAGCRLIRPLLFVPRAEILAYCVEHDLRPRYDRSNEDTTFFRNRLRQELLPLLESYNPRIHRILGSTAAVLGDDYELLRSDLAAAWPSVLLHENTDRLLLNLQAWRRLPAALQRGVLREAIHRLRASLRNVNYVHVDNALWLLREGTAGDRMTLPAGLEVVLGYDRFVVGNEGIELPVDHVPQMDAAWLPVSAPGTTSLAGWVAEASLLDPAELPPGWQANADPWQASLDADVLGPAPAMRTRKPGDRFQPLGMAGRSKLLAEMFTNAKIPTPARDRWPLLVTTAGDIAWVCGLRVDERARITATTQQVLHVRLSKTG